MAVYLDMDVLTSNCLLLDIPAPLRHSNAVTMYIPGHMIGG
jgi:hypothetical protein